MVARFLACYTYGVKKERMMVDNNIDFTGDFTAAPLLPEVPRNHPAPPFGRRVGVLLVNLGTPDGTDYKSMRRYLKEFLSDRRVIEAPRLLWWFVLNVIILTFRPQKSGHAYAKIWDTQHNASPLRVITESQAHKLQERLGHDVIVRHAMRYGRPAIKDILSEMTAAGCGRILIAPLYPQYSAATVGSVMDEVSRWMLKQRTQPAIRVLPPYFDHPAAIAALAASIKNARKNLEWTPDVIVTSFHGLPLRYCQKGDVYYCHSHKTARLLAEKLGSAFCRTPHEAAAKIPAPKVFKKHGEPPLLLTFQSRFGKEVWLQPYTDASLEDLARSGLKNILVLCPGFAADCVETLEEIAIAGRESFMAAGGQNYAVIPCLNDSDIGMDLIEGLVDSELMGWE